MSDGIVGFYSITHRATGQFYVGASINVFRRLINHRNELQRGVHHNAALQALFTGWDGFDIEVASAKNISDARWMAKEIENSPKNHRLCLNKGFHEPTVEEAFHLSREMKARPPEAYVAKAVRIGASVYGSIYAAAVDLGMHRQTIKARIKSENKRFSEYSWA